mmetsp:Transcript_29728/g.58902  ORF Transcript_29728/g.58902 Transcript_29728/m.58902 type:complete len:273 (+) Transcript_29728:728-1546(+)
MMRPHGKHVAINWLRHLVLHLHGVPERLRQPSQTEKYAGTAVAMVDRPKDHGRQHQFLLVAVHHVSACYLGGTCRDDARYAMAGDFQCLFLGRARPGVNPERYRVRVSLSQVHRSIGRRVGGIRVVDGFFAVHEGFEGNASPPGAGSSEYFQVVAGHGDERADEDADGSRWRMGGGKERYSGDVVGEEGGGRTILVFLCCRSLIIPFGRPFCLLAPVCFPGLPRFQLLSAICIIIKIQLLMVEIHTFYLVSVTVRSSTVGACLFPPRHKSRQ